MPILVHNSMDLASVLRATHMGFKYNPLFECVHILDWPFQFVDIESICMIKCKLERVNKALSYVYVLSLLIPTFNFKSA